MDTGIEYRVKEEQRGEEGCKKAADGTPLQSAIQIPKICAIEKMSKLFFCSSNSFLRFRLVKKLLTSAKINDTAPSPWTC